MSYVKVLCYFYYQLSFYLFVIVINVIWTFSRFSIVPIFNDYYKSVKIGRYFLHNRLILKTIGNLVESMQDATRISRQEARHKRP